METKAQQALETFRGNFNCAQSVLSAFAEELGLNKDTALKLATPFGAGMAYRQETCGSRYRCINGHWLEIWKRNKRNHRK